jgi:hypothetical protein
MHNYPYILVNLDANSVAANSTFLRKRREEDFRAAEEEADDELIDF